MKTKFTILLLVLTASVFAQDDLLSREFHQNENALLDWEEFTLLDVPQGIEAPPPYPVRHMAEWEELQALAITWKSYPQILTQIALHAAQEVSVLVFCDTESDLQNAQTTLENAGVNMANVELVLAPCNSVWIRDYGPNSVYANEVEDLNFIDWVYNRPSRPKDDAIPIAEGNYLGIPVYSTTVNPERMVNTGGNFMSDGLGTAFASKLILDENDAGNIYGVNPPLTELDIDSIFSDYMGIDRYIKMETLPFDDIHHIDMHMRLLDEETLLVGEYPAGLSDGPQIEANLQYVLDNYNSSFGTPYNVVRVLQPPAANGQFPPNGDYRTYTNAVFVNKTILVPGYSTQYDTTAMRIYKEYYPGYKVQFINCNQMISAKGALHCITKEVGTNDPLWIVHQRLRDVVNNDDLGDYQVSAQIKHRSGISHAEVFYTIDTTLAYQPVTMSDSGNDIWVAEIPHQVNGSQVFYYVSATANSTKTQVRPLPAPAGYYKFKVNDETSPAIETQELALQAIYPNPASAITVVPVKASGSMQASLELRDVFGRKVLNIFNGVVPNGESRYYFNASNLPKGAYFVSLQTEKETTTQRVVVQ